MKHMLKLFAALLFCALCLGAYGMQALACTAVYVGSGVSEDGTILMAKSNDYPAIWPNYVEARYVSGTAAAVFSRSK